MPPTRNILSRRLSAYDPSIFNPPPTLRPAACRFYSWPRSSPAQGSSVARQPGNETPQATRAKIAIEACYSDASSGEEEVDQLDEDDADGDEREVDAAGSLPFTSNQRASGACAIRSTAVDTAPPSEALNHPRPPLRRRTQQANGTTIKEASAEPAPVASSSRAGNQSSSQASPAQSGGLPDAQEDDVGEADVVGSALTRCGYKEHALEFVMNPKTTSEQTVNFTCTTSDGPESLKAPPTGTSVDRASGDIHLHIFMGGVQLWVYKTGKWVAAQEGDPHPVLGKSRVLSHREPRNKKLPNWVLHSTLVTYNSRKRVGMM